MTQVENKMLIYLVTLSSNYNVSDLIQLHNLIYFYLVQWWIVFFPTVCWLCYCSDFRRKWNNYARCGFLIQSIFTDRNNKFQQFFFLYPIENINFLSSNVKRYFTDNFLYSSEGLKVAKFAMFWTKLCFEDFIHNTESLTRIIYKWRILPLNKIVSN